MKRPRLAFLSASLDFVGYGLESRKEMPRITKGISPNIPAQPAGPKSLGNSEADTSVAPKMLAVLFADVSGSTELYEKAGDAETKKVIDVLFGLLKELIEAHRGWLIKTIGDELMCLFETPADAAKAACAMQRFIETRNRAEAIKLFLRIGFHAGSVIFENNDVFGGTVNTAARIAGVSVRERILLSRATAERLPEELVASIHPWRIEAFKGKEAAVEVVELVWRADPFSSTVVFPAFALKAKQFARLTLSCQGRNCVLEPGGKSILLGRGETNDLVVADPEQFVSSSHGQIEIRGGMIELVDTSRNGIYVAFQGEEYFAMNKRLVLRGSGRMSLGRTPNELGAIEVEFDLK